METEIRVSHQRASLEDVKMINIKVINDQQEIKTLMNTLILERRKRDSKDTGDTKCHSISERILSYSKENLPRSDKYSFSNGFVGQVYQQNLNITLGII